MKIWMIILSFIGSHRVQAQQLLVNTTCLELAKPSNQQLRLTCSNPSEYHCLLDENFTKEFEVCREWKWIPGGKCAYFNSYGRGNIDERNCNPKINLTCSFGMGQFSSADNTKYTACYVKEEISTSPSVTRSPTGTQSDGWNRTVNGTSDGGNATSSSNTIDRPGRAATSLPVILGIIVPPVSIAVIYFILMHLKYVPLYRKAKPKERQELSDIARTDETMEKQPFLRIETEGTVENPPAERHNNKESQEVNDQARNDDTTGQQPILKSETEDIIGARRNETPQNDVNKETRTNEEDCNKSAEVDIVGGSKEEEAAAGNSGVDDPANESKLSEIFNSAPSSPDTDKSVKPMKSKASTDAPQNDVNNEIKTNEVDSDKSAEVNTAGGLKEEELTAEKSDGENDKEESTEVFDDTSEGLQNIVPTTDEQSRQLCTELYSLLQEEGQKLTKEVMTAVITKETGKAVKTLLNNLTDQNKSKLKTFLPEESHRILESKTEHDTSFHVLYGLNKIFLDEKHHPKSGWGNPIRRKDIGVGDDVDRLYRIMTIVCGIAYPVNVSVESYIRLLDIMTEALTRLDPDAESKEDYKALANKLTSVKNPTVTQKMVKHIKEFITWQK